MTAEDINDDEEDHEHLVGGNIVTGSGMYAFGQTSALGNRLCAIQPVLLNTTLKSDLVSRKLHATY